MDEATLTIQLNETGSGIAPAEQARRWAPKLKALGEENRLAIALLLAEGPRTVKELQEATGLSQALVSHHLRPLRERDLVTVTPRGRSNVYALCCEEFAVLVKGLAMLASATDEGVEACGR